MFRFLMLPGNRVAQLFRFLAVVVFFVGAAVTGVVVLVAIDWLSTTFGAAFVAILLASWIFFVLFWYGLLMVLAHAADYIYTRNYLMMESDVDERG